MQCVIPMTYNQDKLHDRQSQSFKFGLIGYVCVYVCVCVRVRACVCLGVRTCLCKRACVRVRAPRKTERMRKMNAFQALAQQATQRSRAIKAVGHGVWQGVWHGKGSAVRGAPEEGLVGKDERKTGETETSNAFSGRLSSKLRADSLRRLAALVRHF